MQKNFTKEELKLILTNAVSRGCQLYIGGFLYSFDFELESFNPVEDLMVLTSIPLNIIESVELSTMTYTDMVIRFSNNRSPQPFFIKEKVNPVELLIFNEWWLKNKEKYNKIG